MTLQASGTLGFSEIVGEFGGAGSHSLSEYRALSGKGVVGIPAAGAISFSAFRGKSNQVITSVWTPSGYNNSVWGLVWTGDGNWPYNNGTAADGYYMLGYSGPTISAAGYNGFLQQSVSSTSHTVGNTRYTRGDYVRSWDNDNGNRDYYKVLVETYTTTWVDTSSYVNTTTTAQITT
jgi:hypothetical protein